MLGLRLGSGPRTIVTTTPRPVPLVRRILALPHSAADFRSAMNANYADTRLGRQELEGLLLEDLQGALWTRDMIEKARVPLPGREGPGVGPSKAGEAPEAESRLASLDPPPSPPFQGGEFLRRTVIGVDPPASAHGDSCGIVVCGLGGTNCPPSF